MTTHCEMSIGPVISVLQASKANVFDIREIVQAMFRSLSPDARLFDSAKSCFSCRNQTFIHPDHSHLEILGNAPCLANILRVEVASESAPGHVGDGYTLFFSFESDNG